MPCSGLRNVFLIAMTSLVQSWIGAMNISWKGRQKWLHAWHRQPNLDQNLEAGGREKLSHKPWQKKSKAIG